MLPDLFVEFVLNIKLTFPYNGTMLILFALLLAAAVVGMPMGMMRPERVRVAAVVERRRR